ncbi:MAG: hypothetical protein KJ072_03925 [Verrucomicrobia bacterium]|nr:hypothetical protein [Verrucomicrobiota bacterium]
MALNGNGGNGGGNPTADSVAERLGINCELELLAKFDQNQEAEGGLLRDGPYESQFIIKFNTPQDGTWELIPGYDLGGFELKAWAAKGGTDWVGALIGPGADSGTWSTVGLGVGNDNTPAMSNLTFWGCKSVPEPGSILAGIAALGMFALGRKRLA